MLNLVTRVVDFPRVSMHTVYLMFPVERVTCTRADEEASSLFTMNWRISSEWSDETSLN